MDSDYELPVAADADWAAEHQRADGHTAQQAVHPQLWSRSIPPPVSLTLPPERPQRPAGMRPQEGRADRATLRPPDAIGMRRRFSLPEQRGVLHWLGTARGTQVYINPVVRGCVTVWLSSICRGDGAMLCDCHFNQQCLFTRDVPWSWATLYLHTASVRPTAYRLGIGNCTVPVMALSGTCCRRTGIVQTSARSTHRDVGQFSHHPRRQVCTSRTSVCCARKGATATGAAPW
eukprot:TRINITY_DN26805_c0_g1_i2.p1 TRINITY_DN26805_c0_g1~~TRINITY_DN26805_c0_g1_i2.p1  ORF type:complete len:232 (+),score=3.49 TRINITY_DN26805_c0_g1_i2:80-775(+)